MILLLLLVTFAFLGAFVGCDQKPAAPAAAATNLPAPTFGDATITGHVKFIGTPPERKMFDTSSCQDGPKAQQEETIVVSPEGGLRDVIVYLKDAPASDGSKAAVTTLDQVGCRYVPHVVAVQVGQPLKITTSDPFLHNVHYSNAKGSDVNFGMSTKGETKDVSFAVPQFASVNCNVHPWMHASVGVISNPFFAVSAADGSYSIPRVPAGHYTIAAWHPILGERTASLDVAANGTASAELQFAPPTAGH